MAETSNSRCNVVILDDEPKKAAAWCADLRKLNLQGLEVSAPSVKEFQEQLDILYGVRQAIDEGKAAATRSKLFDDADVLVVDYDLRHLADYQGHSTGEEIAYTARLFSWAKIVVVVNHPNLGLDNFDLTLQRDRELRGDVYLGHKQISNRGLWAADFEKGSFVPWSWPVLVEDAPSFEVCKKSISSDLDKNTLDFFGLNTPDTRPSPEMLSFLGIRRDKDVPIGKLIGPENASFVRPRDVDALLADSNRLLHVLTALLRKWLRRWVLPAQTILADLPHLATALPWVLKNYKDRSLWNELAVQGRTSGTSNLDNLLRDEAATKRFKHECWLGRPIFPVRNIRTIFEQEQKTLLSFNYSEMPSLAFAEDLSAFVDVDKATEYPVSLDGETQLRYVDANYSSRQQVYSPQSLIY